MTKEKRMPKDSQSRLSRKFDKKKVLDAVRILGFGTNQKWVYVKAKDLLLSLAKLYTGGNLALKTDLTLQEALEAAKKLDSTATVESHLPALDWSHAIRTRHNLFMGFSFQECLDHMRATRKP